MPAITWPSAFPALSPQYSVDPQDATLRSKMSSGRIRQRQQFTVDVKTLSVSWSFDDITFRRFESWFRGYLALGSAWFNMPVALGGGLVTQQVRFVGSYSAKPADGYIDSPESTEAVGFWTVSGRLEVFDSVGMDSALLSLILDPDFLAAFDAGLEATADLEYEYIHVTLPASLP